MTRERRKHQRVPLLRSVRYKFEDIEAFKDRHASDLSMGGMFIQTEKPETIGTVLYFEFQTAAEKILAGYGRVVRVNGADDPELDPGMGIEFLKLEDRSLETLRELLQQG